MNIIKRIKKGFTLIELIVVIAVIAILSAVSIGAYVGVINSANLSNDRLICQRLNETLYYHELSTGKVKTINEALEIVDEEGGFNVTTINAKTSGYSYQFDDESMRFMLVKEDGVSIEYKDSSTSTDLKDYHTWIFVNEVSSTETKCQYLVDTNYNANVTVQSGFDAGSNTKISSVTYTNTSSTAKDVILRTNGGMLTVNAKVGTDKATSDTVNHYGSLDKLDVVTNASYSYHENGKVQYAIMRQGKVIAEDKAIIEVAVVTNVDAYAQEEDTGVINVAYATSTTHRDTNNSSDEKKKIIYPDGITTEGDVNEVIEKASNVIARIGSKGYTDIQVALNEVTNNQTINLVKSTPVYNHGFNFHKDLTATFDLSGYTLSVGGSNCSGDAEVKDGGRAIYIGKGNLTVKNGTIDGRSSGYPDGNPSSSSPWSSTRTGGCLRLNGGNVIAEDLKLYNNDGWGNAAKVESNNTLTLRDCEIYSVYGAGLECGEGTTNIENCMFSQKLIANKSYMNTCIAACSGGTINIKKTSTEIEGDENMTSANGTNALYIYGSGGTINVYSGDFKATNFALKAEIGGDDQTVSDADINIYGGNFVGKINITTATRDNFYAHLNIYGGTFDNAIPTQSNVVDHR